MKKIFILLFTLLLGFTLFGCTSSTQTTVTTQETYYPDFNFYDNYMYDFETGYYKENINYAVTSRESVYSLDITLNDYNNVSYIMCWKNNNYYLGYISTTGGINTYSKFINDQNNNYITLPNDTGKIAFMVNKNGLDGYFKWGDFLSSTYNEIIENPITANYTDDILPDTLNDTFNIPLKTYEKVALTQTFATLEGFNLINVFEDVALFDDRQLVTNGDFSDGTTGWVVGGNWQISNGKAINNTLTQDNLTQDIFTVGVKYYYNAQINLSSGTFRIYLGAGSPDLYNTIINGVVSGVKTALVNDVLYLQTGASGAIVEADYIYAFNVSTLIANTQYSPMFQTTFDLMSDADIKSQMDEFVNKPYLFIDYEYIGIDDFTTEQMDFWYSVYDGSYRGTFIDDGDTYLQNDIGLFNLTTIGVTESQFETIQNNVSFTYDNETFYYFDTYGIYTIYGFYFYNDLTPSQQSYYFQLFKDYYNDPVIDRYEWYKDYGITQENYDLFLADYEVQELETVTKTFINLNNITVTDTYTGIVITPITATNFLDNFIERLNFQEDIAYLIFTILFGLILMGVLIWKGADKIKIILAGVMIILLAVALGWIPTWLIILVIVIEILLIILTAFKKGGN